MLMKSAPVVQLLRVGHFLYQKKYMFKKFTGVKYDFFKEEIHSLLQVILIHMGIIRRKDKFFYVMNTDNYEYVISMFWDYCKDAISEEEMVELINVLKMDEVRIIEAIGESVIITIDSINVLNELKNLIDLKRNKLSKFIDDLSGFIRDEIDSFHTLEEISEKGY
jgi:hypothetical protein